ncbi:hypothetical protein C8F04DRAFT_1266383 [Mycena alexandri]|uniref:F-box domain-containing protein n=1 Tax=Mycena alexandri TaxID=1745969 RepID=A0AAD6SIC1_9AGAR|nr:hypothetical protein C8F04DRAFT_1269397 [Mycena alexandri]KAJ7027990.1 hypothetical protein C8F04DRAFT_1266383 [Mycena alexandri]
MYASHLTSAQIGSYSSGGLTFTMQDLAQELLDMILKHARDDTTDRVDFLRLRRAIISVCMRWKNTACRDRHWWRTVWLARFMPHPYIAFALAQAPIGDFDLILDATNYTGFGNPRPMENFECNTIASFLDLVRGLVHDYLPHISGLGIVGLSRRDWRDLSPMVIGATRPTLRRLSFDVDRFHAGWLTVDEIALAGWNSLDSLVIGGADPLPTGLGLYSQLTVLKLCRMMQLDLGTHFILGVLQEASQLVMLELNQVECYDAGHTIANEVTLPRLEHLRLVYGKDRCAALLRYLSLPHLLTFNLEPGQRTSVARLLLACGHILQRVPELDLYIPNNLVSEMRPFWTRLRDVSHLIITSSGFALWNSVHDALTTGVVAWPMLQRLAIADPVDKWDVLDLHERLSAPVDCLTVLCPAREMRRQHITIEWQIRGVVVTSTEFVTHKRLGRWD